MSTRRQPSISYGRRRFLRHLAVAGGAAATGSFAAACGDDGGATAGQGSGTSSGSGVPGTGVGTATSSAGGAAMGTIGLSLNGLVDYTKGVASGVYEALDGSGYDLVVLQADFDASTETSNLESLIAQGVSGLVIQPNTAEGAAAGARQASEAGIPVANCLWPGPSSSDEHYVGVAALDSVEGGRMMGEWLAETLPDGGPIVVVQGVVGQGFTERIDEGLDEALAGTGLEVVVRQQGFFDRSEAVNVVESALVANPDVVAVVDYAAAMGNGICQLLESQGRDDIVHVTSDADAEMMDWIATPYLSATRYYSSAETGLVAARAVLEALAGESPEFERPVLQVMATADDIEDVVGDNPFFYDAHAAEVDAI